MPNSCWRKDASVPGDGVVRAEDVDGATVAVEGGVYEELVVGAEPARPPQVHPVEELEGQLRGLAQAPVAHEAVHAADGEGRRHMEYVRERGTYRDLPFDSFEGGAVAEADAAICADGVNSVAQEELFAGEPPSAQPEARRSPADAPSPAPLAARLRPRTLSEYTGLSHILGPGKLLRRVLRAELTAKLARGG